MCVCVYVPVPVLLYILQLFSVANRPAVKAANPTLSFGDYGKIVGTMWHSLSEHDRALWKAKAAEDSGNGNAAADEDESEDESGEEGAEDAVALEN